MSDNIPFDLQLAFMNRLPVKSLLQFRTVSKLWKYSIDCSDFVIDMPEEMLVGEFLPPYFISQLEDSIIISGSFNFGNFRIIYAWELEVDDGEVSSYRQLFTIPYPAEHELKLIGFSKDKQPIVEAAIFQQWHQSLQVFNPSIQSFQNVGVEANHVRIIPGPAGLVQRAKLLKENVFILDPDVALMSTQEYMQKVVEDVGEDADFNSGAWVSATNYVNAFGGTVTGCLGDIDNFLKKGKLEQVVAIVKSCSPNALGDLNVTLKDLSGTVPGTINYKVLDVGSYGKDITVGAAMILANVSVFTPKPSKHYLNITKRNVVEVFRKDTVLGSGSG
ncbi:transposase, MuDR, MULE transposase domain protein [Tanacetum coccineum]|uniref:Transposase, MuDR, MULE transposase domain protein n=1 Tax=Tanacetum coccineum TaxID=301880 RepID=A0ABQ5HWN8_9ASTR